MNVDKLSRWLTWSFYLLFASMLVCFYFEYQAGEGSRYFVYLGVCAIVVRIAYYIIHFTKRK